MFEKQRWQGKRRGMGWGALLVIFGLGLLLLFVQTPMPPLSGNFSTSQETGPNDSQAQAGEQGENADANEGFLLAEYDASANVYLDNSANDERPLWQISVEMGLKLAIVIGLIYAAIAGLRWLQGNKRKIPGSEGHTIRILETTNLAPNRALHVVVVGEKTVLIGATDHQLSLLAELPETISPLPDEPPEQLEQPSEFDQTLDWQVTLGGLRSNIQRIRESVGSKQG